MSEIIDTNGNPAEFAFDEQSALVLIQLARGALRELRKQKNALPYGISIGEMGFTVDVLLEANESLLDGAVVLANANTDNS